MCPLPGTGGGRSQKVNLLAVEAPGNQENTEVFRNGF